MREVELVFVGVMNETEQMFIFVTMFNRQPYAQEIVMNTALPTKIQDVEFRKIILHLANMTRQDAYDSIDMSKVRL